MGSGAGRGAGRARGTAARRRRVRGLTFRRGLWLAVPPLVLLVAGTILLVGGSRPDAAVSLSRGEVAVGLAAIFLVGVVCAAVVAWLLAGSRGVTIRD